MIGTQITRIELICTDKFSFFWIALLIETQIPRIELICTDKFSFFLDSLIYWNTDDADWTDLH